MLKIDFVYVEEWEIQQKVSDMNWREIGEIYNYLHSWQSRSQKRAQRIPLLCDAEWTLKLTQQLDNKNKASKLYSTNAYLILEITQKQKLFRKSLQI